MRPGRPARLLRLVAVVVGARGQAPVPNFLVEVRSGRDAAAAVATVASAVVSAAAGGGGRGLEFTIAAAEPSYAAKDVRVGDATLLLACDAEGRSRAAAPGVRDAGELAGASAP